MANQETEPDSYGEKFKSIRVRGKALAQSHELYVAIRQILAPDFGAKVLQIQGVCYGAKTR